MDNPKTQVTLDTRHRMKTNKTKNTTQKINKSNNSGTSKVKIFKNERDPPLFTGKLLIKFQNILRNTTQVIIRHRVKILFSVISSPITLERQKWKSSKMKGILLSSPVNS
jgi:two-component sensor histidine kinase